MTVLPTARRVVCGNIADQSVGLDQRGQPWPPRDGDRMPRVLEIYGVRISPSLNPKSTHVPQINLSAWVFCTSWRADLEFRATQECELDEGLLRRAQVSPQQPLAALPR